MKIDNRYLHFEVCLIPLLKKDATAILDYSIVKYAFEKFKEINQTTILEEMIRLYYDGKLPNKIEKEVEPIFNELYSEDMRGYNTNGIFEPNSELLAIYDFYSNNKNGFEKLLSQLKPIIQIKIAAFSLKMIVYDFLKVQNQYEKIKNYVLKHEDLYGKDAQVGVSVAKFFEFRDGDKSYYEWVLFRAFLAIKSLQGIKEFVATNKDMIISRMLGAKSPIVLNAINKGEVKKEFEKINERYFWDQLINNLLTKGFIKSKITYKAVRKTFFSTTLDEKELCLKIVEYVKKGSQKEKQKQQKTIEKNAINYITNLLNNN